MIIHSNRCNHCGNIFSDDEAKRVMDCVQTDPFPYYVEDFVCPYCGSSFYSDVYECQECGEFYGWDDMCGGVYCHKCLKEIVTKDDLLLFIRKEFDESAIDDLARWIHERREALK